MRNFFQKIMLFMQGRYGMDALNGCLLILAAVIWTVNIFIFPRIPHLILMLVQLGLTALVIVRALSRNIVMRSKENRTFMRAATAGVPCAKRSCASATSRESTASAVPSAAANSIPKYDAPNMTSHLTFSRFVLY